MMLHHATERRHYLFRSWGIWWGYKL